ncbi:MAG: hypothetical protein HOV83_21430 [Catenulispora sp.]|nr:hypothetical protein [Catenulispora sp.]
MCDFLDLGCVAGQAAQAASKSFLQELVLGFVQSQGTLITTTITAWVHVPSPQITSVAETLRRWMLPFTIFIAIGGIMWQALQMIISRKPTPFAGVIKGLVTVTLWGGVAVLGSQVLLHFADNYSTWILAQGLGFNAVDIDGDGITDFTNDQSAYLNGRLTAMLMLSTGAPGLQLIIVILALVANLVQLALLLFRSSGVIILAGMLQLSAAGSFTPATSSWLRKILTWQLSLIFYKPVAATVYAVAFKMVGAPDGSLTSVMVGLAMLLLTLIALPALNRFFNWPFGASSSGGSGAASMLGGAAAAGMHALATNRGTSGGVTDYSRYMEQDRNSNATPPAGGGTPSIPSPAPSGGGSGSGGSGGGLPVFLGTPGGTSAVTSSTTSAASAGASGGAAATGAATAAGTAAAGPVGLAVGASVEAGKKIAQVGVDLAKKSAEAAS